MCSIGEFRTNVSGSPSWIGMGQPIADPFTTNLQRETYPTLARCDAKKAFYSTISDEQGPSTHSRESRRASQNPLPSSHRDTSRRTPGGDGSPWILVTGVPTTVIPSDVVRLIDQRIRMSDVPGSSSVSRMITEARPVYMSASLTPSNLYLFKTIDPKYDATIIDFLHRKTMSGQNLRARLITADEAETMSSFRIADIVSSTPAVAKQRRGDLTGDDRSTTPVKRFSLRQDDTAQFGWLPNHRSQYGKLIKSIVTQTPGRVVLLRGLPSSLSPDVIKRRLERRYKLVDPSESRLSWYDERTNERTLVEVEPVLRLHTFANRFLHVEGIDEDAGSGVIFMVRLQNALDAQRLYRSFHRQVWDSFNRSYIYTSFTRKLIQRRLEREQLTSKLNDDPLRWRDEEEQQAVNLEEQLQNSSSTEPHDSSSSSTTTTAAAAAEVVSKSSSYPGRHLDESQLLQEADRFVDMQERLAHRRDGRREGGNEGPSTSSRPKIGEVRHERPKYIMEAQIMY